MPDILTDPSSLTPDMLNRALERRGLKGAEVTGIRQRAQINGLFSVRVFYEVLYASSAPGSAPGRIFLKLSLPDSEPSQRMIRQEVDFYRSYGDIPALPLVPYFDAAYSDETGAAHLLLEDLSVTHTNPPPPLPPARPQADTMVDALAMFHTYWWEHTGLGDEVGEKWGEATIEKSMRDLEEHFKRFSDLVGDLISDDRKRLYQRFLAAWPKVARRLVDSPNLTLIHGDAHAWNCLLPKDPDRDPAYLIDLCTYRIRPGPNDLAYMMALMWFPDVRARWEKPLLERYYQRLLSQGVKDYSRDDFKWDYRFGILCHLFTPVFQASGGFVPATTWWYSLERILAAFRDLDCDELLL
jgi:Phosphotransferase enzyme family